MHETGGPGWRITMDTSGPMLIALYIRDAAGLNSVGHPALCHVAPKVRGSDHLHLIAEVGGTSALKTEWEAWWAQILKAYPDMSPSLAPPGFQAFSNSPALRRVLQAHFGAALSWARERRGAYQALEAARDGSGAALLLADMVEDSLLEAGRAAREFTLTIIELPLAEPRAWYLEPDKIIMSNELLSQPELFRSYVQPVVDLLV